MNEAQKLAHILDYFGLDHQEDKLIEEMAELTQAIIKFRRDGYSEKGLRHLQEEMEDVRIVLDQLAIRYGRHPLIRGMKIDRTIKRIEEMASEDGNPDGVWR